VEFCPGFCCEVLPCVLAAMCVAPFPCVAAMAVVVYAVGDMAFGTMFAVC
jgi:hypothetical protein